MAEERKFDIVARFVRSIKDIKNELQKVVWLSRKQLINNTITVLISCFLVGALICASDVLFTYMRDALLK